VLVAALVACQKDDAVAKVEGFRDRLCACPDIACVTKVHNDLSAYASTLGERKPSDDEAKRLKKANSDMGDCQQRLLTKGLAATTPDAAPPASDAMTESQHGYCELTLAGDIQAKRKVPLEGGWVQSDYWLSAKTKASNKRVEDTVKKREGITLGSYVTPFAISCRDPETGVSVRFEPSEKTPLKAIKQGPADFTLINRTFKEDYKAGEIVVEVGSKLAPLYPKTGTLRITRFEQGELEATFEMDTASIREPPDKVRIEGKVVYHCAGRDRCGTL
jgi:hypothetical protein